ESTKNTPTDSDCETSCDRSKTSTKNDVICDKNEIKFWYCECIKNCCKSYASCTKLWLKNLQKEIEQNKPAINISNNLVEALSESTLDTGGDLIEAVQVFAEKIVKSIDGVLSDRNEKAWQDLPVDFNTDVTQNLLRTMHEVSLKATCDSPNETSIEFVEENIIMESFALTQKLPRNFTFPSQKSNITTKSFLMFTNDVILPKPHISECKHLTASGIIYKRVRIILNHLKRKQRGDEAKCMFWDFDKVDWSEEGCRVVSSFKTYSVCECDHLTNFAVLMDISGRETTNDVKKLLSLICSFISVISLIITIACLNTFRALRNRRSVIKSNLCICLLAVNLLVSFGLKQTQNTVLCQIISMLLLYVASSAFLWMVVALSIVGPRGFYNEEKNYFCWISCFDEPAMIWIFAGPALVFNGLQGFFIFLFEIVMNKKARQTIFNEINANLPLPKSFSINPLTLNRTKFTLSSRVKTSHNLSYKYPRFGDVCAVNPAFENHDQRI
ncbi:latrophilin Cirl-like protein, partial [Dinothrombium tinctorium]